MKTTLIALALLFATALPSVVRAARTDETARLNQGAILKEITIPDNQPWAFVRVQALIDAAPPVVWSKLEDIGRFPTWLPMCRKMEFLSPEATQKATPELARDQAQIIALMAAHPSAKGAGAPKTGHWDELVYEEYDLPWPIKNEWALRRYVFDEKEGLDRAAWTKVDSADGKEDGYWEIRPWEDGKRTHLRYYYRVKAKENVPKPVFRTAISLTVNSMIKALRHQAAMGGLR